MTPRGAWTAYGVVFTANACTLVLEISAGRLLASYFGVSLYTWTSIIGVTSQREADGHVYEILSLDRLIHSYNSLEDPARLHYPYLRTYAALTAYAA